MLNDQHPWPLSSSMYTLEICDIFSTIQGEGPFSGAPATFIRLAGCNLQCPGCDTQYTSDVKLMHIQDIKKEVEKITIKRFSKITRSALDLVVITGGEPFRQQAVTALVHCLLDNYYAVQIETNGTLAPPNGLVDNSRLKIICAPKTSSINKKLIPKIMAYKYVLSADNIDETDGLPIQVLGHPVHHRVARPPSNIPAVSIYVQPQDSFDPEINAKNLQATVLSSLAFGYTLNVQLHKIAGLP